MLRSMQLINFRGFADTGKIELHKLNVFIGPNNAGKTTFANGVEIFLRSARDSARNSPLAFSQMPIFASFDAILRRHWSRKEKRPTTMEMTYELAISNKEAVKVKFICADDPGSNADLLPASRTSR